MDSKPGERPPRKSSTRSSISTAHRSHSPTPNDNDSSRRTVPERKRQKKKDYSPEVSTPKTQTPTFIGNKSGRRKSHPAPEPPKTPSPVPELGKRAPRPSLRYSPPPRNLNTSEETEEPAVIHHAKYLLSTLKEAFLVDGEVPQQDFELPPRIQRLWKKKKDRIESETAPLELPPSTPKKATSSKAIQLGFSSPHTLTFEALKIKEEVLDDDGGLRIASEAQKLFETVAIKQEPVEESDNQISSSYRHNTEVDMKPTIKSTSKRRKSSTKNGEEETKPLIDEPPSKRSRAGKDLSPPESSVAESSAGLETRRTSRRSTAGFKEFMAQVKNPTRRESAELKPKGQVKIAKKVKEEPAPAKEITTEPSKRDEKEPSSTPVEERLVIIEDGDEDGEEEEKYVGKKTTPKIRLPQRNRSARKQIATPTDSPSTSSKEQSVTPSPSPALVRRSSRGTVPSARLLEINDTPSAAARTKQPPAKEEEQPEKISVKPKPGSALEILKKASKYQRRRRSPTPETVPTPSPAASMPSSVNSSSQVTPESKKEKEQSVVEKSPPPAKIAIVPDVIEKQAVKVSPKASAKIADEPMEVEQAEGSPAQEASTKKEESVKANSTAPKEDEEIEQEDFEIFEEIEPEPAVQTPKSKRQSLKGTIKITPKGRKAAPIAPKSPEKKAVTTPVEEFVKPAPIIAARRSGRALKPKIDSDYVLESPVTIRKEVDVPSPRTPVVKSPPVKSPVKSPLKSPVNSPPVAMTENKRKSVSQTPVKSGEEEESAAEKTRKYVEEHKGSIKLSFKIGETVATVLKPMEEQNETTVSIPHSEEGPLEKVTLKEEPSIETPKPATSSKQKKPKEPHWWTTYKPSSKPVLENFVRSDGTIEHLGVVINSVMDNLLLKVCDDGIKRHSNHRGKEARKHEIAEMAKKRYHDKKKIAEERMARGEHAEHFPPKKSSAELFAHTISTRERTKKGALYKSNEFLLKPVKQQREYEQEKEQREQEARDYLNKQFMREAEEDLRNDTSTRSTKKNRPSKRVSFKDFLDEKGQKVAQALKPSHRNADYFHREILRESDMDETSQNSEIDTDEDDTLLTATTSANFMEHAQSASEQICTYLMRRVDPDGSCNIYDMVERVREEPEIRRAIIGNTIEVLIEFQQVQLGVEYSSTAHITLHNEAQRRAHNLRDAFSINNSNMESETMSWTHSFLLQNLPADYLPGYLILLRYWKHQASSAVAKFAKRCILDESYPWPEVTEIVWSYITGKVVDPDRENLQATINVESLSDVIFVLVPPAFQFGDYTYTTKAHDAIYRWLKSIGSKESFVVDMEYKEVPNNPSILEAVHHYVAIVKAEVQRLVKEMRDKRIVLVGWRLSSYINHRVVQLIHGVSAIIDLAFNQKTQYGYRGGPDDDILLTYCPSLFIVGSHSTSFNAVKLKEMRASMQCETGAVVLHYGDDHLFVPTYVLNRLGITQRSVFRSIVEYITEFLNLPSTKKERSQLIQVDLNSVYNVELDSLKAIAGGGPAGGPQRVQKYPSADGKPMPTPRPRKRKTDYVSQAPPSLTLQGDGMYQPPSAALAALMSHEAPVCSTAEARYRFDEIVRNARTISHTTAAAEHSPLTTPRTAPVMYKALASPRIQNHPMAPLLRPPMLPPQLTQQPPLISPVSQHPLDPANISLN